MQPPLEKFHSLPDMNKRTSSQADMRKLYSLSLSQIKKHADFTDYRFKPAPFNLRWVYGYNPKAGVINLNNKGSTVLFYAGSNYGILYNWTRNQMRILQGHRHMITCLATDTQGKWLVTADSGPENIIIIWDSGDSFPQRTIFAPHGNTKLSRVALSSDAKYLLTLVYTDNKANVYWWIWSEGRDDPHVRLEVDITRDAVLEMEFNPYKSEQFLLLTKQDIWIGVSSKIFDTERGVIRETEDYQLKIRKPDKKLHSDFGKLTCFTFVKDTCQILVATSRGGVLVYGYTMQYQPNVDHSNCDNLKFIKVLNIQQKRINVIRSIDGVIVTGNAAGEVHFYDDQMKLLYWVHGFTVDSIKCISFNISPRSFQIFDPKCNKPCPCWETVKVELDPLTGMMQQKLLKKKLPSDATTAGRPFLVRDFVLCTNDQGIAFVNFATEKLNFILDYKTSYVLALSVHPEKPLACLGNADGLVELIAIETHKIITRLDLRNTYKIVIPPNDDSITCNYDVTIPKLSVTYLKYSPSGLHLACGLNTGQLLFLDPITIDILTKNPHQDTSYAIKEISYSPDSLTLAFADVGKTVCVYKYDCNSLRWNFIGKHRAHYKDITALFFLPFKNDNGYWKLLSLGADRMMADYDIGQSSDEYLEIHSLDRVEQSAVPLAGIVWPTPKDIDPKKHRADLILVANDEHKYKIMNYNTTMTLATVLGPRYESPVSKMKLVTRKENDEESSYLLFATKNLIGLQKMSLDGNPWKHVSQLGHPNQITVTSFREDIGNLFTIGARDTCMCQWGANYNSVDHTSKQGGINLDPYYCLIENGRPGWLFQEIRDLFYYIQILCQGTFSPAMRHVKDYIPIESLPDLMRALGFFPSEYEVENLLVEAKYKVYEKTPSTEIDFEEFVKLYINHRPAFGENMRKIQDAFKIFAAYRQEDYVMDKEDFVEMLCEYGECFSKELARYLLTILSGQSYGDTPQMSDDDFSFLPQQIRLQDLLGNIMGVRDCVPSEQTSLASARSSPTRTSTMDSED